MRPASGSLGEKEKRETYNGMQVFLPFSRGDPRLWVFSVVSLEIWEEEMACLEWAG